MPHTMVIFGASGDLTSRKLIPALYELHRKSRLPEGFRVVGVSRTKYSDEAFREHLHETTNSFVGKKFDPDAWASFAPSIFYHPGNIQQCEDFQSLASRLEELEGGAPTDRVYYLSTAPQFYSPAVQHLGACGLVQEDRGARRVVIEKPFGVDLSTAQELNRQLHEVFHESQVYRIDHYLGKETVQNLLVLRFANTIFEPIWNRHYVDHVQITAAEEVTVGRRAGYYDTSGVLRDMFQNHLLQLLMFVAMEAPLRFEADAVRSEKVKVLQAVRKLTPEDVARDTIRGRYQGYLQEPNVPADSETATFAALKLWVDNWRWQGVPFYLRSGKAMSCRTTQILVQFKSPPHMMFGSGSRRIQDANQLIVQIQPDEGIQLKIQTKVPDAGMALNMHELDFKFHERYEGNLPEAYQRLLLDALQGDASLFARSDEVEFAWGIIDPILQAWQTSKQPPLLEYEAGGWGPDEAWTWMHEQGRLWFDTCPVL